MNRPIGARRSRCRSRSGDEDMRAALVLGLVVLTVILKAAAPATRQATTEPAAKVTAEVHIGEALPPGTNECPKTENHWTLQHQYGTQLALTVVRSDGDLLGIDPAKSKLEQFEDDRRTDLRRVAEKDMLEGWPGAPDQSVCSDLERRKCNVHFWFPLVASDEAKSVSVRGTVMLICGRGSATSQEIKVK